MEYYLYRGVIKDTKDEWLHYVGDLQFQTLLDNRELILITENLYT